MNWPPGLRRLASHAPLVTALVLGTLSLVNLTLGTLATLSWGSGSDFREPYAAATIGLTYGWDRIYDVDLQRTAESMISARQVFEPYFNPPVLAWICAPLAKLPFLVSFTIWVVLEAICLAVAVRLIAGKEWRPILLYAGSVLAVLPLALAIAFGQPVMVVALGLVSCWWLNREGHPVWAGVALAAIDIKPQLALVVPIAMFVAGYWRPAIAWAAVSIVLAVASLASLGVHGTSAYLSLLLTGQTYLADTPRWSPAGLIGGPLGMATEAILVIAGFTAIWRCRAAGPEAPMAIGCLLSLLVTPYLHNSDLITGVIAVWLLHRARLPELPDAAVGLLWIAVAIGTQFPAVLLVADAFLFGRLAGLWWPPRARPANSPA